MRTAVPTVRELAFAAALSVPLSIASPAHAAGPAKDTDLAQIRAQLQQMKDAYEQRIAALEQRLAQAESTAGQAARSAEASATQAQVAVQEASLRAAPPAAPAGPASGFNPEVSLILQGQYKSMKDVPERAITGFWPAGGHDHGADPRGFSLDHSELVMAANIDPWWRGQLMLGLQDDKAEVEEAWFQSLGIGHGIGLKAGRIRSGIGYLNEQHAHAWDFADAPLIYKAMFGEHGSYAQDGVQLKWVAPTETFVELGAELGRGAAFPGTDRNKSGSGSGALFAHFGGDVGANHSWRTGVSYLRTAAREREAHFTDVGGLEAQGAFAGNSRTWIADFVWKWAPNGNPKYQNFKLQGEWFQRREQGTLDCRDEDGVGNACAAGVLSDYASRQSGWYLQGVYQFTPNWRAGARYDRLDSGRRDFGVNAANLVVDSYRPSRASLMADYSWSEFSRLRLQFARDRSMLGFTDNQVTLQYIMSLGAHGAHKF